jgi:cation diffusion facilitator CzcD-associated flavoprotein CzcO
VSVVTDEIERFTERGIALASGSELEADVIVTATGLNLQPLGGIALTIDGSDVAIPQTFAYRGAMLSGVPNLAFAFGYVNQSWTLGADLTCQYVCRLLNYMDAHGYDSCTPRTAEPIVGSASFWELSSGYVRRGGALFPRQSSADPWYRPQSFPQNRRSIMGPIDNSALEFARARRQEPAQSIPA